MIPILHDALRWLFYILHAVLIARIILSWMPMFRGGRIASYVFAFTEPILAPIRKLIDRSPLGGPGMMLDFSPIVAFFLLGLLRSFLLSFLAGLA